MQGQLPEGAEHFIPVQRALVVGMEVSMDRSGRC